MREGKDRTEKGHALVRAVDRDIDDGVLVDVAEEELGLDDELLGLEACAIGQSSAAALHAYTQDPEGRRTSGDEDAVLVELAALGDDALHDVRNSRTEEGPLLPLKGRRCV